MYGLAETRFHVLGRACHLAVEDHGGRGQGLLELATAELRRIEERFREFRRPGEDVATAVPQDEESQHVFRLVGALRGRTGNLFDPTLEPVSRLWRGLGGNATPNQRELAQALARSGWQQLVLESAYCRATLPGMQLNLSACVCPHAVDRVHRLLKAEGVRSALIDLDKDVRTIGRQPDGSNWLVGLRYPLLAADGRPSRTAIHRIKLCDAGLAIRGNFENRLSINGENYGRVFSPVDGYPVPGLLSVAVRAHSCRDAAAAADVARCLTEERGLHWLQELELPWQAIDRQLACRGTLAPGRGAAPGAGAASDL